MTVMVAAPTTPVSWLRAPDCSATAVREPLVLTGNPWNRPAATLAAPMPTISWSARTSCPFLAANDRRGRDRVGQGDERDPERADDEQREVRGGHVGDR